MNLVGGYESSDDEDDGHKEHQNASKVVELLPEGVTSSESSSTKTSIIQGARPGKRRKTRPGSKSMKGSKKKKDTKIVKTLILSPEIQAALARGDTLDGSDSDEALDKKPRKLVRPIGSNPNNLLSILPQPSTVANAEAILLNSQRKRCKAAETRLVTTATGIKMGKKHEGKDDSQAISSAGSQPSQPAADETAAERDDDSLSNGSVEEDLLENMRAKSRSTPGSDGNAKITPLFTLPSRSKPPPSAMVPTSVASSGKLASGTTTGGEANASRDEPMDLRLGDMIAGQSTAQFGGCESGVQNVYGLGPHAGHGTEAAPIWGGNGTTGYGTIDQEQRTPYYTGGSQTTTAGVGGQGADLGTAGGKASKRKGRDMERALARGDLGALGDETPVMDLHQGSNEFNPLRSRPTTAAMKPEQKHIEASVYDPRTGTTKTTLEPTSLQKRKHQINQLATQAASMERDLMERSGASRITKAQTRSKYGW